MRMLLNPYIRTEAQSFHSSAMELALLSSNMQRKDATSE
jgi:hypothetical protein